MGQGQQGYIPKENEIVILRSSDRKEYVLGGEIVKDGLVKVKKADGEFIEVSTSKLEGPVDLIDVISLANWMLYKAGEASSFRTSPNERGLC